MSLVFYAQVVIINVFNLPITLSLSTLFFSSACSTQVFFFFLYILRGCWHAIIE